MSVTREKRGAVILGHPRSGTTLLRRLLGAHPSLAAPPETHIFSAAGRFIQPDMTAHGVDMGVLAGLSFAGFEDSETLGRLRTLAFGFLADFAKAQGKPRWIEKTAFDIFMIEEIEKICGDEVFYIGVVRHPLDVAVSTKEFCDAMGTFPAILHRYVCQFQQPVEAFVQSWIDTTTSLFSFAQRHPENAMICRYEDLSAEPAQIVEEILRFIGEKPTRSSGSLGSEDTLGFADHKTYQSNEIRTDRSERWRALPSAQVAKLEPRVRLLIEKCGYDPLPVREQLSIEDARRFYLSGLAASKQPPKG